MKNNQRANRVSSKMLQIRITPQEARELHAICRRKGIGITDFVRGAVASKIIRARKEVVK